MCSSVTAPALKSSDPTRRMAAASSAGWSNLEMSFGRKRSISVHHPGGLFEQLSQRCQELRRWLPVDDTVVDGQAEPAHGRHIYPSRTWHRAVANPPGGEDGDFGRIHERGEPIHAGRPE